MLIKPIGDNLEVGTRVHWDAETQNLYYVDVPNSTIYRYRPSTDTITKARVGDQPLAFAFPVEGNDDLFIAGLGRKIVLLRWDGVTDSVCSCNTVVETDINVALIDNRLNGAKVDPYGRLWAGTMGPPDKNGDVIPERGSLYSLTQGKLKCHLKNIGISNGIAFDTKLNKMYYIDTLFRGVYQFDYDGESGEIDNKQIIFDFENKEIEGLPDGLTIDQDGNLWMAIIYGSEVIKFDPRTGTILYRLQMPTSQITAVTFGNKNLNVLYVSSARMAVEGKTPQEPAGCTFKVEHISEKGLPGNRYKL